MLRIITSRRMTKYIISRTNVHGVTTESRMDPVCIIMHYGYEGRFAFVTLKFLKLILQFVYTHNNHQVYSHK